MEAQGCQLMLGSILPQFVSCVGGGGLAGLDRWPQP